MSKCKAVMDGDKITHIRVKTKAGADNGKPAKEAVSKTKAADNKGNKKS